MDEGQSPVSYQQPLPQAPGGAKARRSQAAVMVGVLAVLLIALLYVKWQNTKTQLKSTQAQLDTKSSELRQVTEQLATYRDAIRKTDLASFADAVRAYNTKNHGHLTTEGSISKQIYDTQLSKSIANFIDPETGDVYGFVGVAKVQSPPPLKVGTIQYQWPGKCGEKTILDSNDDSQSVVATLLESGSMYCIQI